MKHNLNRIDLSKINLQQPPYGFNFKHAIFIPMKIEKEIKQERFPSDHLRVHVNLLYTAAWAGLRISQILKPFKISLQQFNILRILRGRQQEPHSIKELTERMLDKSSNASRLVDKLIIKNLVSKTPCDADSRRVEIIITPSGLDLINRASKAVEKEIQTMLSSLSVNEASLLNELLDKARG